MNAVGAFLVDNWLWLLGSVLTALIVYWWWDERQDARTPGETVDRVTDRVEAATGGAADGFTSLVIGLVSIGSTLAVEFLGMAGELNEALGGVPFVIGYLLFGALSLVGIQLDVEPTTLGFAFLLILVIAAMARFGTGDGRTA